MATKIGYWQDNVPASSRPVVIVNGPMGSRHYRLEVIPEHGGTPYLGVVYDLGVQLSWMEEDAANEMADFFNSLFETGKLTHRGLKMDVQTYVDIISSKNYNRLDWRKEFLPIKIDTGN